MGLDVSAVTVIGVEVSASDIFDIEHTTIDRCGHEVGPGFLFCPRCGVRQRDRYVVQQSVTPRPVVMGHKPDFSGDDWDAPYKVRFGPLELCRVSDDVAVLGAVHRTQSHRIGHPSSAWALAEMIDGLKSALESFLGREVDLHVFTFAVVSV